MSGAGNTATGSTIFSDNTVSGGPNDVTVSNLVVEQDLRVDGNFEVGTFSIDDLTVNNNLIVDDNLTVGANIYANYVETVADANVKGSLFLENNIVGNGLSYDRPLKRLRVDNGADVTDVLSNAVTVTNGSITTTHDHNKITIANTGSTRVGHLHLTGTELEVGTTTSHPVEILTNNVPRITVAAASGDTTVTGILTAGALATSGTINTTSTNASSSTTTGALVVTGGVGIGGAVNAGGAIRTTSTTASTSTTTGALVVGGGVGAGGAANFASQLRAGTLIAGRGITLVTSDTAGPVNDRASVQFNSQSGSTHGSFDATIYVQSANSTVPSKGQMFLVGGRVFIGTASANQVDNFDIYASTTTFHNGLGTYPSQGNIKIVRGTVSMGNIAVGANVTQAVTFPVGIFTSTPSVTASASGSSYALSTVGAPSNTGFTANARNLHSAEIGPVTVHYIAVGS